MTPQQQLAAFLVDIRKSNYFINLDKPRGTRSSIESLVNYLRNNVANAQPQTVLQAVQRCVPPNDVRIRKYLPAIQRLVSVWGTDSGYPSVTGALANTASTNFYRYIQLLPPVERFDYERLLRFSENAAGFSIFTAPQGYVARLPNPNGGNLDITSRGLVLRSGLVPEANGFADRSYMTRLQLTYNDLNGMANRSIADVGCGAAVFRAEMETLFGCATKGLDLNFNHVPAGNAAVRQRYSRSMLYLKMLVDTQRMAVTLTSPALGPLITRLVESVHLTLAAYLNNLPVNGDIFNMAAARIAHNLGNAWDYVFTMYLLCYFTPPQQTNAVLSMCGAATRAVYIYNGSGNGVLTQVLTYNQHTVQLAFPNCRIVVKDAATHHIFLQ